MDTIIRPFRKSCFHGSYRRCMPGTAQYLAYIGEAEASVTHVKVLNEMAILLN